MISEEGLQGKSCITFTKNTSRAILLSRTMAAMLLMSAIHFSSGKHKRIVPYLDIFPLFVILFFPRNQSHFANTNNEVFPSNDASPNHKLVALTAISMLCFQWSYVFANIDFIPWNTKKISASHDEIRLLQMIMNTGLHFAEDKIMISAACCLQWLGTMASVSVSRNTRNFHFYVFGVDK